MIEGKPLMIYWFYNISQLFPIFNPAVSIFKQSLITLSCNHFPSINNNKINLKNLLAVTGFLQVQITTLYGRSVMYLVPLSVLALRKVTATGKIHCLVHTLCSSRFVSNAFWDLQSLWCLAQPVWTDCRERRNYISHNCSQPARDYTWN